MGVHFASQTDRRYRNAESMGRVVDLEGEMGRAD
jgi:hypothetical protein